MNSFLYYLSQANQPPSERDIRQGKYGYAFDRPAKTDHKAVNVGPDGKHGVIFTALDRQVPPARRQYDPQNQVWIEHRTGGYWVGMWKDEPPTPADLERKKIIPGKAVELADGNYWQVPIARSWSANDDAAVKERFLYYDCQLETQAIFDGEAGFIDGPVVAGYAELWAIAEALYQCRFGDPTDEQSALLQIATPLLAVRILSTNYRLGVCEASLLGIVTTHFAYPIFDVLNDLAGREEVLQKKRAQLALLNSSAGPADTIPITDPLTPT
jgi:hypothetical protein